MMDIHAEKGMQCVDCHFAQDSHGNGLIYGEVANAVEIGCKDCHGTADAYPDAAHLRPGRAARSGNDLSLLRNPDGQRRFEWLERGGRQRADPALDARSRSSSGRSSWSRTRSIPASPDYNAKAARAKLMSKIGADGRPFAWGPGVPPATARTSDDEMACFTCHSVVDHELRAAATCRSRPTGRPRRHHYEGERDAQLRHLQSAGRARRHVPARQAPDDARAATIAPVRSSSALVLSSTNVNRERIYVQQPPIAPSGFSSQAFAPHFPHTVRTTETKTCTDCHLSRDERQQRDHGAAAAARAPTS